MLPGTFVEEKTLLKASKCLPSVSIILPFEPKMSVKNDLEYRLKQAVEKVEKDLAVHYPAAEYMPVTDKLKGLVQKLDFSTYKQSIALFASPQMEKLFYLDIAVEEKIIIDQPFEVRDLVYSKKDIHKYLILVLSNNRGQVFLGNTSQFTRIASTPPGHITAYSNDIPERVGNFSDPHERKKIMMDKFLRYIDTSLGLILKAYALPLFVMGTDRTVGHFKKLTHQGDRITGCIHGNFEEATEAGIHKAVAPHVADWKKVKQYNLLQRLDAAIGAKKLTCGIREVCKEVNAKRGSLLVVEKNYMQPEEAACGEEVPDQGVDIIKSAFYRKEAVNDVIETLLANGGDVEFVDDGVLKGYKQIALVRYY